VAIGYDVRATETRGMDNELMLWAAMLAISATVIGLGIAVIRRERKARSPRYLENALAPLEPSRGSFLVTNPAQCKFREAHDLPSSLREELIAICEAEPRISACYLLDVMPGPGDEIKLFIDFRGDDRQALHDVAPRMQEVFKRYPQYTDRFWIGMGSIRNTRPEQRAWRRSASPNVTS
jgi:hypothetical protein